MNIYFTPASSQKGAEKPKFSFSLALEELISDFPARSQEIARSRFGLAGEEPKTLEQVGKTYKITRERIRQIIREIIKKVRAKSGNSAFEEVEKRIEFTIDKNSGIIKKQKAISQLGGGDLKEQNAIRFFLDCLENIGTAEVKGKMEKHLAFKNFARGEWENVIEIVRRIFEKEKKVLPGDDLFMAVSKVDKGIDRGKLFDFLSVSAEIKANKFGKWGLAIWSEVTPRVTAERAYLIIKEEGEPLHFTKVAELIDFHKLSERKTHPQTVHNELIKSEDFVLVGRGTYALAEWGYKEGTVKEVLEDILKRSGKPMKRNEILDRVLKMRQVKKSTVLINLNNFFSKAGKDAYTSKNV